MGEKKITDRQLPEEELNRAHRTISGGKSSGIFEKNTTNSKEESVMKLVPLFDRVVLKQLVAEETTKSGIVLPGQAKEKPQQAEVIAVGPGGVVDGKEVAMQVKVGDKVIYSKYSGTEVEVEDEKYVVVKQNDILAVIE